MVMAGYLFGPACYTVATEHPEVLFLALDVTEGDLKAESVPSISPSSATRKSRPVIWLATLLCRKAIKSWASWAVLTCPR